VVAPEVNEARYFWSVAANLVLIVTPSDERSGMQFSKSAHSSFQSLMRVARQSVYPNLMRFAECECQRREEKRRPRDNILDLDSSQKVHSVYLFGRLLRDI
jgi:hypothetical protein